MTALDASLARHFPDYVIRPARPEGVLARWRARWAARRALRADLLRQPDSVLRDFGLAREDAAAEAAKPFWRA